MDERCVYVYGSCVACRRFIAFNPNKVPSIRVKDGKPDAAGTREPLCAACAEILYTRLKAEGQNPPPIAKDAYEPLPEGELHLNEPD